MSEYAVQPTRTITSILRILQKLTKRKPNMIRNTLCRTSSIVWLKVSTAHGVCVCVCEGGNSMVIRFSLHV